MPCNRTVMFPASRFLLRASLEPGPIRFRMRLELR
jgi:hypothetical protein